MKTHRELLGWLAFGGLGLTSLHAASTQATVVAARPPMGWNSFNSYGVYLPQEAAMINLEAMAEKLKPYGYEYFVIDNGWFGEYALVPGTRFANEKHAHDVRLDEWGRVVPSKTYFPDGFGSLVRRARELGIKVGVHLMRGIPRKAVELNLPIQGTSWHAADVANKNPADNCTWCQYNYAVDMTKPGAQAWYDGLIQHIADLGVDFIKFDDIVPYPAEVEAVAKAVAKIGRPIVLSLSPGGSVDPAAIGSFRRANMLRVTHDIWDEQAGLDQCFEAWRKWGGTERPGFWIDMDMITFGRLQVMTPPRSGAVSTDVPLAGKGAMRQAAFSADQMQTFITLRALAASPLMMGGDLPTLDAYALRLITDPDMIACNQNGVMGRLVHEEGAIEIWLAAQRDTGGRRGWIGVFNRGWADATLTLTAARLGLGDVQPATVRDIWNGSRTWNPASRPELPVTIRAGGVLFLRFE